MFVMCSLLFAVRCWLLCVLRVVCMLCVVCCVEWCPLFVGSCLSLSVVCCSVRVVGCGLLVVY